MTPGVEVVIVPAAEAAGRLVADVVAAELQRRPDAVLGLATGSSPLPAYRELIARHRRGEVSFARAGGFLLDEYVGLPPGHPESYRAVIERDFAGEVDFADDAVAAPTARPPDLLAACDAYEAAIAAAGGVDLQMLGIGSDGHVGFNEPGSSLASRTRVKTLTARTRADNARFFARRRGPAPRRHTGPRHDPATRATSCCSPSGRARRRGRARRSRAR